MDSGIYIHVFCVYSYVYTCIYQHLYTHISMCSMRTHISQHAACSSRANSSATVIDLCVWLRLYKSIYTYIHVLYAHAHLAARCLQLPRQLVYYCYRSVRTCTIIYMYTYVYPCSLRQRPSRGTLPAAPAPTPLPLSPTCACICMHLCICIYIHLCVFVYM